MQDIINEQGVNKKISTFPARQLRLYTAVIQHSTHSSSALYSGQWRWLLENGNHPMVTGITFESQYWCTSSSPPSCSHVSLNASLLHHAFWVQFAKLFGEGNEGNKAHPARSTYATVGSIIRQCHFSCFPSSLCYSLEAAASFYSQCNILKFCQCLCD